MSIEAVAIALHHSRAKGTAKLVLLGLANHDGDGGSFPKVATLAKYANVSPRRIPEALAQLGQLGEIVIHHKKGGTGVTVDAIRPNLYEFVLECPPECDRTKHHRIKGEKIGRSYKGQYNPDHVKDPERVERGRLGREKSQEAVDNATIPPSVENSTSAENSTTPSAENSTTRNHQGKPPIESSLGAHVTREPEAVDNPPALPPARTGRNAAAPQAEDGTVPPGLTEEQMSRNRRGAELARAALRGELTFNEAKDDR